MVSKNMSDMSIDVSSISWDATCHTALVWDSLTNAHCLVLLLELQNLGNSESELSAFVEMLTEQKNMLALS